MVNKIQFDIIYNLNRTNSLTTDELSKMLFKDNSFIEIEIQELINQEYLTIDKKLTAKALEYLETKKIDNAIILAAGKSSRFVPLNYEIPKGLLEVKGEIMLERQIRQLREAGIDEIVIVVGYMQEKFEYLKEKYGVKLVYTDEYKIRNNHASVYAARDYLKNSIITSSDLYFTENVFQNYAYDSYYLSIFMNGNTSERGIYTDKYDKIEETMYGSKCKDIWVTLGYAFFSKDFSKKIVKIIENEYELEETYGKFWADIQDDHLDELYMYAKRCNHKIVHEFDYLEELREFDEKYKYNSGSSILKQIAQELKVNEDDITSFTNLDNFKEKSFKFECYGKEFICDMINNSNEIIEFKDKVFKRININCINLNLYMEEDYD